jgi:dTDP-4-amino-4,6-dideoxygalactose transaminase
VSRGRFAVPFARPLLPPPAEWLPFLEPAYAERWFANRGPVAERLEGEVAERCDGGREAVLVSSATAGLVAALLALEVAGPVAMPAFTFPATAHAVRMAGCEPVLCDVDPETWELDPAAAARAVHVHGCRAILHVRPFGFCRDTAPLEAVAADAGVPLIVDSAAAFGGTDEHGVAPGGAGDAEVFSFHATKVMAIGEGGAVLAAPALAERIRRTINFSLDGLDVVATGLNGKLAELPAAVGLAALRSLDAHVAVRRAAVARLARAATAGGSATLPVRTGRAAWQGLPVLVAGRVMRDAAVASLHAEGVEGRIYYSPGLHRTTAYATCAPDPLPVTDQLIGRILCLPVHADLAGAALEDLAAAVERALPAQPGEDAAVRYIRSSASIGS